MIAIVIPAKNESRRLIILLDRLLGSPDPGSIYVVLNGCTDNTWQEISHLAFRIKVIRFKEALGFDVPRVVGAYHAYHDGATGVLFIDGDMTGDFVAHLDDIKRELLTGTDLVLTNCYPKVTQRHPMVLEALHMRMLLNIELGLYHKIGIASPAHGLVGVSRKFLETIPLEELAVPPVSLTLAKKNNLKIKVGTAISHLDLGSKVRHSNHAKKIAHTIIGDCLEAKCVFREQPRSRTYHGIDYLGYHPMRRFDLIKSFKID